MRFGSLFSGIGGFDLALERAGMECAWQVELDDACNRVLARHWSDVPRYRDVRHVHDRRGARCPNCLPAVDVLVGGFPCQDLSVAGRRAGLAGERSRLWFEFHRLAAQLRPRWLVIENVPGLLSSNGGRDFGVIVRGLVELGYGVVWRVLDAQYFGVAQRRRRVFVVGCLGDPARAAQVLLEPKSCGGNPAPRRQAREDAAGSLGSQPPGGGWRDYTDRMMFVPALAPTLEAETHPGGVTGQAGSNGRLIAHSLRAQGQMAHRDDINTLVAHSLRAEGADASEDDIGRGTPLVTVAEPLDASYAKTTDSAGSNGAGPRNVVFVSANQRGELRERPVHGSLNGSKSGKQYDGAMTAMAVRRLTPVECERLQGFPDGWTEGLSDSARYRCLGNAVCVPVMEWIGRRLAALVLVEA